MADPKKSPEIVTEQELKPVLENKNFDSITFLQLYDEWKVTHSQTIFGKLRSMHENAGYNNKQTFTKVEQEMDEIADIVRKYQQTKGAIVASTQ